ncbi:MAG: EamA family transporter [Lacisediminihabitans sp.]
MGYLYALLAAVLFGANGSVTKVLLQSGLSAGQLTLARVLSATVISAAVLLMVNRKAFRVSGRQLAVLAVLGVTGVALLQFSYAIAISLLPVGIALLLEYTAVLMVALVALIFFKERVKARLWVAIGCVLAGLAIVARIWAAELNPLGVVMALLAAVTLTIYFVVGEREVGRSSPLAVAFWTMGFASVFWLIFSGWWEVNPAIFGSTVPLGGNLATVMVPLWLPLLWNMLLGSFVPFFLSLMALKHLPATAAGIVASSEVIFAFAFAWLWLREGLDLVQSAGAAIVLVGIILAQTARADKVVDADLALIDGKTQSLSW